MSRSCSGQCFQKAFYSFVLLLCLGVLYSVLRCESGDKFCLLQSTRSLHIHAKQPAKDQVDRSKCIAVSRTQQVALMFLTRGTLFHEPTWELFFKQAEGLIPVDPFRRDACNATTATDTDKHCSLNKASGVIDRQVLFNVYVHTSPSYPGFPAGSVFHAREIGNRIEARWGTHTLIEAARNLFQSALGTQSNQRFVMLSESGIPLYPPTLIWQQLMSESKSRINACQHPWMDTWRWHPAMNRGKHRVPLEGWRKSSQWMGLIREHAELFVHDKVINELFEAYCSPSNACYSDEHYVPTLLAYLGKDQETDCWGFLVNVDWSRGGAHPRTYSVQDVDVSRMKQLRIPELCHHAGALKLSKHMFVLPSQLTNSICEEDSAWSDKLLDFHCPLFARKFPNATAMAIRNLYANCQNKLDFINCPD